MDNLTKEQYIGWKQDPTTIKVFQQLEKRIVEIQENLGTGGTLNRSSAIETLANTTHEIGKIEGIREIFDMEV